MPLLTTVLGVLTSTVRQEKDIKIYKMTSKKETKVSLFANYVWLPTQKTQKDPQMNLL